MKSDQLPWLIQYIQALGPSAVALVVGIVAAYIAWRQSRTAGYRLRFDLFDRRMAVYEATKRIISVAQIHGQIIGRDLDEFYERIRGADFLFDGDTRDFVMKIGDMTFRAHMARISSNRQVDKDAAEKLIDEEENVLEFLRDQAPKLEAMFARYLDVSKIGL